MRITRNWQIFLVALLLMPCVCSAQTLLLTGNPESDKQSWLLQGNPTIFVKGHCPTPPNDGLTQVGGVLWPTLVQVKEFLNAYTGGTPLCITGGSELSQGHICNNPAAFSHCNGFKVDLRVENPDTSADFLSNYVVLHTAFPGPCRGSALSAPQDGAPQYFSFSNMDFALEYPTVLPPASSPCQPPTLQKATGTGQHWDVLSSYRSLDVAETSLTVQIGASGSVTPSARDELGSAITSIPEMFSYSILPAPSNLAGVDSSGNVNGLNTASLGDAVLRISEGPYFVDVPIEVDLPPTPGGAPQCVSGLPVPQGGCWQWTPGLGGASGGWVWVAGSTNPNPPGGSGSPPPGQCAGNSALNVPQSGCWVWVPNGSGGAWVFVPAKGGPTTTTTWPVTPVTSVDPNDIFGIPGVGSARFSTNASPFTYLIEFENKATATAPAQQVTVTDTLNTNFDLSTVVLGPITFPGQVVTPPVVPLIALGTFSTDVDLRPSTNLIVRVSASLNPQSGVLSWSMISLDPATLQPPSDPLAGFLPPGTDGSVSLVVNAKGSLASGTTVSDQASIVFDTNPAIATPVWSNTIDSTPPVSSVVALPPTESSANFTVGWRGSDSGSGIRDFTVFASDNGGPFSAWLVNATASSATFFGQWSHTYAFYSIARDLVGNIEATKTTAETTTQVIPDPIPPTTTATLSPQPNVAGWNNSNVTVHLTSFDNPGGTGVKDIIYGATGAQIIAATIVNGASTSFIISTEGITTITFFGTDNAGNVEVMKTITIRLDKTPPTLTCSPNPNTLWPPNNKLVPVNVSVNVTDSLSGPAGFNLVSVTSSEPGGLGDIQGFVVGTPSTSGQLQAQRLGSGSGRTYSFIYSGADRAGNLASCTTTVSVPHDQGK
jgi:hypothetical protein